MSRRRNAGGLSRGHVGRRRAAWPARPGRAPPPRRSSPAGRARSSSTGTSGSMSCTARRGLVAVVAGQQHRQPGRGRRAAQIAMTRGSGSSPTVSSRPARRMPFMAARQALRITSCRSPGTMTRRPSAQQRQQPGHGLRGDDDVLDPPVRLALVEHPDVEVGDDVAHPRPAELGAERAPRRRARCHARPGPSAARCTVGPSASGSRFDHRAHHPVVLAGPVGARGDRHRLGQALEVRAGHGARRAGRRRPAPWPARGWPGRSRPAPSPGRGPRRPRRRARRTTGSRGRDDVLHQLRRARSR